MAELVSVQCPWLLLLCGIDDCWPQCSSTSAIYKEKQEWICRYYRFVITDKYYTPSILLVLKDVQAAISHILMGDQDKIEKETVLIV